MVILREIRKYLITNIIILVGSATFVYAGSFTVIPVVTEVEVIRDVCPTASHPGALAFELLYDKEDVEVWGYVRIGTAIGNIYKTTTGHLVVTTGSNKYKNAGCHYDPGERFRVTPGSMPNPLYGSRGTYYILCNSGTRVEANLL